MTIPLEPIHAIELTVRLISVCLLIDSLEKLSNYREFRDSGIFGWKWIRQFQGFSERRSSVQTVARTILSFKFWLLLQCLRILASVFLLALPDVQIFGSVAFFILFAAGSIENFRRLPFRPETPNRFSLTIVGGLLMYSIYPTEIVTYAVLWFIALQSCLSYATAGIVKLFNRDWISGEGIYRVVNSPVITNYPKIALFLKNHKILSKSANYLTILIEILFPLVLIVGEPYFLIFLLWGFSFHMSNVFLLRFNTFFWVWIATYPAIIFVAQS